MQHNDWLYISWAIGAAFAAVLLAASHLAARHWVPAPERIHLTNRYTAGTVCLWIGFALWRILNHDWQTPLGLLLICIVGGAIVKLAYHVDYWVLSIRKAEKAEAVDDDLQM